MKRRFLALGAVGAGLAALFGAVACGSDGSPVDATSASSGAGGGGTGATGATGTGQGGSGGTSQFADECAEICAQVEAINCVSWPNCATECPGMFNAPADCADEYQALLDCWLLHKAEFMCSQTQVLPPAACSAEQEAFNACFGGGNQTTCEGQVCNEAEGTCACKTACVDSEFKSACTQQGAVWVCSCYDHDKLLGNCSYTPANPDDACDNYTGCCPGFFYPE